MKLSSLKDLKVIRKELDEVFALSCRYTFGPMGVTHVTIR